MTSIHRCRSRHRRKGAVVVMAAVLMVILVAMVAFAVDIGYVNMAESDLQRTADAAALAAVLEYRGEAETSSKHSSAREAAALSVTGNHVLRSQATIDSNSDNSATGDVVLGRIDMSQPRSAMTFDNSDDFNAVRVRVQRTAGSNGEVPLFFARAMGFHSLALEAQGTAAIIHNVGGFKIPGSGVNVPFLPITIKVDMWEQQLAGNNDDWEWDPLTQSIEEGDDGIPEVVLYPNGPDAAGNFGTVNVGISANSTSHLAGQIRNGLSQSDLDFHGGTLELDDYGELLLTGDPGLSASIKDDLSAVAGVPRIIPLYDVVQDNGNNATFRIVRFVGVRIMAVKLTSGQKFVSVQPANVTYDGVLQGSTSNTSDRVYSPPVLVQ